MNRRSKAIIGLFIMLFGIALGFFVPITMIPLTWIISGTGGYMLGYNL